MAPRTSLWLLPSAAIGAVLLVGLGLVWSSWGQLPAVIATHWGIDGTADGFTGRSAAVVTAVALVVAVPMLLLRHRGEPG